MTVQPSSAALSETKPSHTKTTTKRRKSRKSINDHPSQATNLVTKISPSDPVDAVRVQSPTAAEEVADSASTPKRKRPHTKIKNKRKKSHKLNADASQDTDLVTKISPSNPVDAVRVRSPTAAEEVADSASTPKRKRSHTKIKNKRKKSRKFNADASQDTDLVTKISPSNPVDSVRVQSPTAAEEVADSAANSAPKTKRSHTKIKNKRKKSRKLNAGASQEVDNSVANNSGGADTIASQDLGELFKGSDVVADSVLDGFYSIRDMDGFEKWISDHKSTLCNSGRFPDKPNKKTLVLDLDNTLISTGGFERDFVVDCNNGNRYSILLHPDCITFLHEMAARYTEIAIYTSSSFVYATEIVFQIKVCYKMAYPDTLGSLFSKILSSGDCILDGAERKKDLLRFRSLDDVVFVDDDPYYSMRSQNDNVIQVRRFHGEKSQRRGLMAIVPLLSYLSSVDSVPSTMRKLKKVWYSNGLVEVVQSTMGVDC